MAETASFGRVIPRTGQAGSLPQEVLKPPLKNRYALASCWLSLIVATVASADVPDGRTAEKKEILSAWQHRQQHWQSVRFRFSGKETTPAGYMSGYRYSDINAPIDSYPAETRTSDCSGDLLVDYQRGRVRIASSGETHVATHDDPPFPAPTYEILVFDGERYQAYRPEDRNLSSEMVQHEMRMTQLYNSTQLQRPAFPEQHIPLLLACGELMAAHHRSISAIGHAPENDHIQIVDNVEFRGTVCTILRTSPTETGRYREYWVKTEDPRQIVRYDVYRAPESGGLWLSMTIDYEPIDGEPIPHRWEVTQYSFVTGKPRTYVCQMESFEANPKLDDSEFVIEEEPGMIVHDSSRPQEDRRYVAALPGQPEIPYLEFIRREQAAKEQSRNWLLYGLLAIGTVLLLAAWLRHRRQLA